MKTSAERKETARQFLEEHANTGQRIKTRAFYDDDPDKIIPRRGPRGRKTGHPEFRREGIKYSSILARLLASDIEKKLAFSDWRNDIGTIPAGNSLAPFVVVDTSVLTRAIGTKQFKDCRRMIDLVMDGKIRPCVTHSLVKEYRGVIGRGQLPDDVRFDDQSYQLLDEFLAHSLALSGRPQIFPATIEADPTDDILLIAQALVQEQKGKLCAIVSRDNHLLNLPNVSELNIMYPTKYLNQLAAGFPQSLLALNS